MKMMKSKEEDAALNNNERRQGCAMQAWSSRAGVNQSLIKFTLHPTFLCLPSCPPVLTMVGGISPPTQWRGPDLHSLGLALQTKKVECLCGPHRWQEDQRQQREGLPGLPEPGLRPAAVAEPLVFLHGSSCHNNTLLLNIKLTLLVHSQQGSLDWLPVCMMSNWATPKGH